MMKVTTFRRRRWVDAFGKGIVSQNRCWLTVKLPFDVHQKKGRHVPLEDVSQRVRLLFEISYLNNNDLKIRLE